MSTSSIKTRYDLDRVTRLIITIVCVAAAVFVINYLRNVLLPFLIGGLLAYMLNPLVEIIQKALRLKGRAVASILAIVIAAAVVYVIVMLHVFPLLASVDNTNIAMLKNAFLIGCMRH